MKNPYSVISKILVTERAMDMKNGNKYVFKVDTKAGKIDIKSAVEKIYDVKVASVNVMNRKGKPKRAGKISKEGKRPDTRKAIVTLSNGSIDII